MTKKEWRTLNPLFTDKIMSGAIINNMSPGIYPFKKGYVRFVSQPIVELANPAKTRLQRLREFLNL